MNIASSGQQIPRHCFVSLTDQGQIFHWLSTLPKTWTWGIKVLPSFEGEEGKLGCILEGL